MTTNKEDDQQLQLDLYNAALKMANLMVWEFDIRESTLKSWSRNLNRNYQGFPEKTFKNAPDSLMDYTPDAGERLKLKQMYDKVMQGEPAGCEVWHLNGPHGDLVCDRVYYSNIIKEDGRAVKAYGVTLDITETKHAELYYERMINNFLVVNPTFLYAFHLNLTKDLSSGGHGISESSIRALQSDTASGLFSNIAKLIKNEGERQRFLETYNCQKLVALYQQGRTKLSKDYFRTEDNSESGHWVTTYVKMFKNPGTGEIEATVSTVDTDARIKEQKTAARLVDEDHDCIGLIDTYDWRVQFTHIRSSLSYKGWAESHDFDEDAAAAARMIVSEKGRQEFLRQNKKEYILEVLKDKQTLEVPYLINSSDGIVRKKVLKYRYLDETKNTILFTVSDVTAAFKQEQLNAQRLEVALTAAKQASSAKSNFLSRMSHEIRTPMNAIIGMDAIAAQSIGNDDQVSDCISKIGLSARYLLSLINDILDMSRIESGKMLLKNEKFLFSDFITGINTMIYNQAVHKGLDYECIVSPQVDEYYLGDAMKLQQVLINILGNAVKFTDRGKVSLEVHPVSQKGKTTKVRFIVNDTGRGIKEKFLPKVFDAFEQEDSTINTTFGGTGLGLAISKNLVDMMGGTIKVRSIVGVGTEFTVEVPLTVDESSVPLRHVKDVNLAKLHALVVDDDIIICEQASSILKDIGMSGEWVTSGREAVEKVMAKCGQAFYYDFILIDWKMPDMDGVETTRQIRKIVGPDVTIIIISAYDWETIESDARAAGANLLISKPLFKATLISAFKKAKGLGAAEKVSPVKFDFAGKRVLVAEDNAINAEIAKKLLENRNFAVEIAPNGLKAMEMFVKSPVHYYDVILMDVRMPVMDGLQATSNIRHWDKADARTIPIVAMTANAFDEDVEKSRAAGMNAHLSKPIEPELLYRTLYRIIYEEEK
jgi:two-component system sensor histidine kinase/response regulator